MGTESVTGGIEVEGLVVGVGKEKGSGEGRRRIESGCEGYRG